MEIAYFNEYSPSLGRNMEFKRYGTGGKPCLVFPCMDGRFFDYENFGMPQAIAPYLEGGKLQLFCVDGIDGETWTNKDCPPRRRIERQEQWYHYVVDELTQRIRNITGWEDQMMVTGCSMGAFHAADFFFRRPDYYDILLGLSGTYNAAAFFGDYSDELVYANSPAAFLPNLPPEHPYHQMYREGRIILCVGQGDWEEELLAGTRELEKILRRQGIPAWVDYWGTDVSHDWPWWKKQMNYFLEHLFGAPGA